MNQLCDDLVMIIASFLSPSDLCAWRTTSKTFPADLAFRMLRLRRASNLMMDERFHPAHLFLVKDVLRCCEYQRNLRYNRQTLLERIICPMIMKTQISRRFVNGLLKTIDMVVQNGYSLNMRNQKGRTVLEMMKRALRIRRRLNIIQEQPMDVRKTQTIRWNEVFTCLRNHGASL